VTIKDRCPDDTIPLLDTDETSQGFGPDFVLHFLTSILSDQSSPLSLPVRGCNCRFHVQQVVQYLGQSGHLAAT
jgi:hypothetical protein